MILNFVIEKGRTYSHQIEKRLKDNLPIFRQFTLVLLWKIAVNARDTTSPDMRTFLPSPPPSGPCDGVPRARTTEVFRDIILTVRVQYVVLHLLLSLMAVSIVREVGRLRIVFLGHTSLCRLLLPRRRFARSTTIIPIISNRAGDRFHYFEGLRLLAKPATSAAVGLLVNWAVLASLF